MKRIFTLVCVSAALLFSTTHASAQKELSARQKQVIQEEVLPAVFKQVNQQFGIDILSFMQPEQLFRDVLKSSVSSLRADGDWEHTEMVIKPDSVIIPLDGNNLKLTFQNYYPLEFPTINRFPVNIQLPKEIAISGIPEISGLNIVLHMDPVTPEGSVQGGINVYITLTAFGPMTIPVGELTYSKDEVDGLDVHSLDINIDGIRETLSDPFVQGLLVELAPDLNIEIPPVNFRITVTPNLAAGVINASLLGVTVASETIPSILVPMSDATVALAPAINITTISYTEGVASEWERSWVTLEQANAEDLVLTMEEYKFGSAAMTDSTYQGTTVYTMSDYTGSIPTTGALVAKAFESMAAVLRADYPPFYKMVIEETDGEDPLEIQQVIEIIPYMQDATTAIARILIDDYEDGVQSETSEIRATADALTNSVIVEFLDGLGNVSATLYFNSNVLGVLGNEEVAVEAQTLTVSVTGNGLSLKGADKGTYRIINMVGNTLASGKINSNFIQIPNLYRGIYILVVTDGGKTQAVKFAK